MVVELVGDPRCTSLVLEPPDCPGHRAGSTSFRLTAEDGYQAQRSYSIASADRGRAVCFDDRAPLRRLMSRPTWSTIQAGRELELRGRVGGYFVGVAILGGPLLAAPSGPGRGRCEPCCATTSLPAATSWPGSGNSTRSLIAVLTATARPSCQTTALCALALTLAGQRLG